MTSGTSFADGLPPATVQKIINEVLATNPTLNGNLEGGKSDMTFAKDARDVLIECCVEFITMLSSEANDIAEKDAKKTIACEHITKALEELDFGEYVPELQRVAEEFKATAAVSTYGTVHWARRGFLLIWICTASRAKANQDRAVRHDSRRIAEASRPAVQGCRREVQRLELPCYITWANATLLET